MKKKTYASTSEGKRKRKSPEKMSSEDDGECSNSELEGGRQRRGTRHRSQMSNEYDTELGDTLSPRRRPHHDRPETGAYRKEPVGRRPRSPDSSNDDSTRRTYDNRRRRSVPKYSQSPEPQRYG